MLRGGVRGWRGGRGHANGRVGGRGARATPARAGRLRAAALPRLHGTYALTASLQLLMNLLNNFHGLYNF